MASIAPTWAAENPNPSASFTSPLAMGVGHACVITEAGLKCWGPNNAFGQQNVPPNLGTPFAVAAGDYHTCTIVHDLAYCWGKNDNGQRDVPDDLPAPVMEIAAGYQHTCAIAANQVHCWAKEYKNGQASPEHKFADEYQSGGFKNPRGLVAGEDHTCVITDTGVRCWGLDSAGQASPPKDLPPALMLAAGAQHTCALLAETKAIRCWGKVIGGPLEPEAGLVNPRAIFAGKQHTCAQTDDGLRCWGADIPGVLSVPPQFPKHIYGASGGWKNTCVALRANVHCWGKDKDAFNRAYPGGIPLADLAPYASLGAARNSEKNSTESVFAEEITLKNPRYPGTDKFFLHPSQFNNPERPLTANGICKVLGYEKATSAGAKSSSFYGKAYSVDDNGELVAYHSNSLTVSYITCQNLLRKNPVGKLARIENPKYPGQDLPFTALGGSNPATAENGVCRLLGFARALKFSSQPDTSANLLGAVISETGELVGVRNQNAIKELVCIDPSPAAPPEEIFSLKDPKVPGTQLPFRSGISGPQEHGVCKALGYESAVIGSASGSGNAGQGVTPDEQGKLVELTNNVYPISQIICKKRLENLRLPAVTQVDNPLHPGVKLPFLLTGQAWDESAICRAMGFEYGVRRSATSSGPAAAYSVYLDQEARVSHLGVNANPVGKVLCVNARPGGESQENGEWVNDPVYPGTSYAFGMQDKNNMGQPSEKGTCRLLGYERAARGSGGPNANGLGPALFVDEEGKITQGGSASYRLGKIFCLNPSTPTPPEAVAELKDPVHPGFNLPFANSPYGQQDLPSGICKSLGYERGVNFSAVANGKPAQAILVDNSGQLASVVTNQNLVSQVICLNRLTEFKMQNGRYINVPTYPGTTYAFGYSNISGGGPFPSDGICRLLGYSKSAAHLTQSGPSTPSPVVYVNPEGKLTQASPASTRIENVFCLDKTEALAPESVTELKDPVHPGFNLPFYYNYYQADLADGVCAAMGFERGLKGSTAGAGKSADSVQVDAKGSLTDFGTNQATVSQVACLNPVAKPVVQRGQFLVNPTHPNSGLLITNDTPSMHGICRINGFARALAQGQGVRAGGVAATLTLDAEGKITAAPASAYTLAKVFCLEPGNYGPTEESTLIQNPQHPVAKLPFSATSSEDGVCKALGHDRAAKGSLRNGNSVDTVQVDADGKETTRTLGYSVGSLVCIKNTSK
ncbi:MAG: RCC1 domain-containing protein [Bacteriovoracia bacterium]